jgi:hypothetical protein
MCSLIFAVTMNLSGRLIWRVAQHTSIFVAAWSCAACHRYQPCNPVRSAERYVRPGLLLGGRVTADVLPTKRRKATLPGSVFVPLNPCRKYGPFRQSFMFNFAQVGKYPEQELMIDVVNRADRGAYYPPDWTKITLVRHNLRRLLHKTIQSRENRSNP